MVYIHALLLSRETEGGKERLLYWNIKGLYSGMWASNVSFRSLNLLEQHLISSFQDRAAIQSSFVSQWSLLRNPELCRNVKIFVENSLPADATWAKTWMLAVLYLMNRTYLNTDPHDPHGVLLHCGIIFKKKKILLNFKLGNVSNNAIIFFYPFIWVNCSIYYRHNHLKWCLHLCAPNNLSLLFI